MIAYPHLAAPNIYLANGYKVEHESYGEVYEYQCEDALEECIRHALILVPHRLNGPQLRFLRRGVGMSQEVFARHLDRDSQTIARIEKNSGPVPAYVDLTIRALFLAGVRSTLPVGDLVSLVFSRDQSRPEKIILSYIGGGKWVHSFEGPSLSVATATKSIRQAFYEEADSSIVLSASPSSSVGVTLSFSNSASSDRGLVQAIPMSGEIPVSSARSIFGGGEVGQSGIRSTSNSTLYEVRELEEGGVTLPGRSLKINIGVTDYASRQ